MPRYFFTMAFSSRVCHIRELIGCSSTHGMPAAHSHCSNLRAARKVWLPSFSRLSCRALSWAAGKPQGFATARMAPPGPRSAAVPHEEQGGPSTAPRTSPLAMALRILACTAGSVRSPAGPCMLSKNFALAPDRSAALPTPPVPQKRSSTYLPFHSARARGAPGRAVGRRAHPLDEPRIVREGTALPPAA